MTITPISPLDSETEAHLVKAAQEGNSEATETLVRAHVRYMENEARKYAASEPLLTAEDLLSAAIEGFLGAIATYRPDKGANLLTHARPAIAEAMADEKAVMGRAIAVPGRTLRKYRKAIRETDTIEEARKLAAEKDGMDPATFDAVHFVMAGETSLDAPVPWGGTPIGNGAALNGGEGDEWGGEPNGPAARLASDDVLLGSRGPAPITDPETRLLAEQALALLADNERARRVVVLAYGPEGLSDVEIASRLGVSRPTITRLRNGALATMRAALEG